MVGCLYICYFYHMTKANRMNLLPYILMMFGLVDPGPGPMYTVEKLNNQINTRYDEINPVISLDGKTIYFTRVGHPSFDKTLTVDHNDYSKTMSFEDYTTQLKEVLHQLGEPENSDPVTSPFNQDIWIATSKDGEFDKIIHPSYPLNSALPNSACAVTTDPDKIVIVNQFYKEGGMQKGFSFASKNETGSWKFPEPIFIYDYYNLDAGVNLTLSKDNEVMILSMNRNDSEGENDLYVSFRVHTTLWNAPLHMGDDINTPGNEITPFLSDDKRFLFFSAMSNNPDMGQDIYVSERLDDSWTEWSTPRPLPQPINSFSDEAQPFLNEQTGFLYFTSTREGSSDIYRVNYRKPESKPRPMVVVNDREKEIRCIITDGETGNAIPGELMYGYVGEENYSFNESLDIQGMALNVDHPEQILKLKAKVDGYITREIRIDIATLMESDDEKMIIKVPADPVKVNTRISMSPIFFMRGKERILSGSYDELNRLYSIMKQHPSMQIMIEGHTDNVGDDFALLDLSKNRALAIKRYLVQAGVQSYRISTKGYGSRRPITDNSTEALRAKNRRVEVVITRI